MKMIFKAVMKLVVSVISSGYKCDHRKVVIVFSMEARVRNGNIQKAYGRGLFSYIIKNRLGDHNLQEAMTKAGINHEFGRAMIVRPMQVMNVKSRRQFH